MDPSSIAHQSTFVQIALAPPVAALNVRGGSQNETTIALSSEMPVPESTEDSSESLASSPKKQEYTKKIGRRGCRRCCITCLSGWCCILGFVFIGFGICADELQQRYTPIFKDVICDEPDVDLSDVKPHGFGLEIDLAVVLKCHNPNYYSLKLQAPVRPGNISLAAKSKRRLSAASSSASARRSWTDDDDDEVGDDDDVLAGRWSTSTTASLPTTTTPTNPQGASKGNLTKGSDKNSILASESESMRTTTVQQATEDEHARKDTVASAAKKQMSDDDDDDDDDSGESKSQAQIGQPVKSGDNNVDKGGQKQAHNDDDNDDDDLDHLLKDDDDLDHIFDGNDDGEAPLGTLELIPSTIAPESDGIVRLKAKVVFKGLEGIGNGIRLLDKTNIQFDLIFDTVVQPFLGVSFTVNEDDKCGVQIDATQDKTGDLVCDDSYDKLKIPPINESAKGDEALKLGASAKDLEDASNARDKYMGLAQTLGYGFGAACFISAILMLSCCLTAIRRESAREPTLVDVSNGQIDDIANNV